MSKSLLPKWNQWKSWTLPSKWSVIGGIIGLAALLVTIIFSLLPSNVEKEADAARRHRELDNKAEERHAIEEVVDQNRHAIELEAISRIEGILAKEESERGEYLLSKYPFGYVLFSSNSNIRASLASSFRDELKIVADWQSTKILLIHDKINDKRIAQIVIPNVHWERGKPLLRIKWNTVNWTGEYTIGTPVQLGKVFVENEPGMFFEVLSDEPGSSICVVGFKLFEMPERDVKSTENTP